MKKIILISILSTLSLTAFAQVPEEFQDLVPPGKKSIRLIGSTDDQQRCFADLSLSSDSFSAFVAVLGSNGDVDSRRFGTFQLGLGHELQNLKVENDITTATSTHKVGEQSSSDSRSTLKVSGTGDGIKAVQVVFEEKGFFGFKTKVKETCIFN